MIQETKCGKMLTVRKGGFVVCPECERRKWLSPSWRVNRSLIRIDETTTAERLPVYCRSCQVEIKLDIQGLSCRESLSQ